MKKIHKEIIKSSFKFVFLTRKFKEKNQLYVPEFFSKCND